VRRGQVAPLASVPMIARRGGVEAVRVASITRLEVVRVTSVTGPFEPW